MTSTMTSTTDYTQILLAQLTDLQGRVTKQDAIIASLVAAVERLKGSPFSVGDTMRTSVPLRSYDSAESGNKRMRPQVAHGPRQSAAYESRQDGHGPRQAAGRDGFKPKVQYPSLSLSDVLKGGEEVTIKVGIGKDDEGIFKHTTALAVFDGTDLVVKECALVTSLVGKKSSKPGEILYSFIDELKNAGHIKRTFTIAPWKLCSVERAGETMTLEDVRAQHTAKNT